MEKEMDEKKRKGYYLMRMTYDLTMSLLVLGMAVVMLFAEKLKIEQIIAVDITFRYLFGSICLLYGGFRLYRVIKRDY